MNELKQAHLFIEGRVQGVGFRHFVRTNARRQNVNGWVRNLPDGRVEAVIEGPEESVQNMIDTCKRGPGTARVSDISIDWENPSGFNQFEVRF